VAGDAFIVTCTRRFSAGCSAPGSGKRLSPSKLVISGELLTLEQVRRAANVFLETIDLPRPQRRRKYEQELQHQRYHQRRNATASRAHHKTRLKKLRDLGIDPDQIKSVFPKQPPC